MKNINIKNIKLTKTGDLTVESPVIERNSTIYVINDLDNRLCDMVVYVDRADIDYAIITIQKILKRFGG